MGQKIRLETAVAKDGSLLPPNEADLTPISVGTDPATLDLTAADSFSGGAVPQGVPLILLLYSTVDFVEGQAPPSVGDNLPRAASQIHAICVNGRSTWYLDAATSGTVKGKLLLAL